MTPKLKVTLILLATLAIGIVLGAVGRGVFMKGRHRKLDALERTEFFLSRVNEAVNPDSSQKGKVEEIARRTAERITVLFDHHDAEMATLVDSMKHELAAVLTPWQQQRLNQELAVKPRNDSSHGELGVTMAFSYEYAERLQRELDLDSAQTEQMLMLVRESHDRIMKQAKLARGDREKVRRLRESFLDETNKKIEALLNAKQREQFRQLRKERERFVEHELREEED